MGAKSILFVINTMGQGGAETAMIELMKELDRRIDCQMDLYVMLDQGDLIGRVPSCVNVLNKKMDGTDVLSAAGRRRLYAHTLAKLLSHCSGLRNLPYMIGNYLQMARSGPVVPKNLLWKAVSDGSRLLSKRYDMAIAFLEGAATYYVAERVQADVKAAFVHIDYRKAGYTRRLDHGCYDRFQAVFCVSQDVKNSFLSVYPELSGRTALLRNTIDPDRIRAQSLAAGGFADSFSGVRIVSLGRLVKQKAFETAIAAARILLDRGHRLRWYVFGEGDERASLEREIRKNGVEDSFVLAGAVQNPFPYLRQAQIYVQCSSYEGQSLAVREAMVLGLPVVLTQTSGNRGQITDGVDGLYVGADPRSLSDGIERLILNKELREKLGQAAAAAKQDHDDVYRLLQLIEKRDRS